MISVNYVLLLSNVIKLIDKLDRTKGMKTALTAICLASIFPIFMAEAYALDADYNCGRFFTGGPGISRPPEWEYNLLYRWTLDVDGQKYDILYDGYITNVTASTDRHSIQFDGRSEGTTLQLRLPRALIDSTKGGHDMPFTVLLDGQPLNNATESVVPSTGDRMVCIPLSNFGPYSRVEVIGTTIAPEFGALAVTASITMAGAVALAAYIRSRAQASI